MIADPLAAEDCDLLLAIARAAIHDRVNGGKSIDAIAGRARGIAALAAELGAFVTLKSPEVPDGQLRLRGCIGTVTPRGPLHLTVARCAGDSACADPRFPAVVAAELESLTIQISVIGPVQTIEHRDAIVPGRHGVVLTQPPHQSLFLPQVATEQGWDTTELLDHLALKAGLKRGGWRTAQLAVFEAQVF